MSFASSEVYEADRENVIPIGYCVVPCKLCLRLVALPVALDYICCQGYRCVRVIDLWSGL